MPTIFDIKRFALHDGPGIRTTVFFKGCPLRCSWCHNPESHHTKPEQYTERRMVDDKEISMARVYGKKVGHAELLEEILRDKVFFLESDGGVTFSGGEPLMQSGALVRLLEDTGKEGLHRAVDTSGHASGEILMQVAAQTDLFLYDLKLMDPGKHQEYTGVDNRQILRNADRLLGAGAEVIFRIPLIPGVNDTDEEISAFQSFLRERKNSFREVHLLPYHTIGKAKYRRLEKEYGYSEPEGPRADKLQADHLRDDRLQHFRDALESLGLTVLTGG